MESTRSIIRVGYDYPYSTISENMLGPYYNAYGDKEDFTRCWTRTSFENSPNKKKGRKNIRKRRVGNRIMDKAYDIFFEDFLSEKAVSEITTVSIGQPGDCVTYTNGNSTVININNGCLDGAPSKLARELSPQKNNNITNVDVEYKPGRASNFNVRKTIENRRSQRHKKKAPKPAVQDVESMAVNLNEEAPSARTDLSCDVLKQHIKKSTSTPNLLVEKIDRTSMDNVDDKNLPMQVEDHVKKLLGSSRSLGNEGTKRSPLVSVVNISSSEREVEASETLEDGIIVKCSQEILDSAQKNELIEPEKLKDSTDKTFDFKNESKTEILEVSSKETFENGKKSIRTVITLGASDPPQFSINEDTAAHSQPENVEPIIESTSREMSITDKIELEETTIEGSEKEEEYGNLPVVKNAVIKVTPDDLPVVTTDKVLAEEIMESSQVNNDFSWDFEDNDKLNDIPSTSTPITAKSEPKTPDDEMEVEKFKMLRSIKDNGTLQEQSSNAHQINQSIVAKDSVCTLKEWITKTKRIKDFDWKSFEKKCRKTYESCPPLLPINYDSTDSGEGFDLLTVLKDKEMIKSEEKEKIKLKELKMMSSTKSTDKHVDKPNQTISLNGQQNLTKRRCQPEETIADKITLESHLNDNLVKTPREEPSSTIVEKPNQNINSLKSTWIQTVQLQKPELVVNISEINTILPSTTEKKFTSVKSLMISPPVVTTGIYCSRVEKGVEQLEVLDVPDKVDESGIEKSAENIENIDKIVNRLTTFDSNNMNVSNESLDSEINENGLDAPRSFDDRKKIRGLRARLEDSPWEKLVLIRRERISVSQSGESTSGVSSENTSDDEKEKIKKTPPVEKDGPLGSSNERTKQLPIKSRLPVPIKRQTATKSIELVREVKAPLDSPKTVSDKPKIHSVVKKVSPPVSHTRLCKENAFALAKRDHISASIDSLDKCVPKVYAKTTVSQALKVLPAKNLKKPLAGRSHTLLNLNKPGITPVKPLNKLSKSSSKSTTELATKVAPKVTPAHKVVSKSTISLVKKPLSTPSGIIKPTSRKFPSSDEINESKKDVSIKEAQRSSLKINAKPVVPTERKATTDRLSNRHALCSLPVCSSTKPPVVRSRPAMKTLRSDIVPKVAEITAPITTK